MSSPVLTYNRLQTLRIWGGRGELAAGLTGRQTARGMSYFSWAGPAMNDYGVVVGGCRRQIAGCLLR